MRGALERRASTPDEVQRSVRDAATASGPVVGFAVESASWLLSTWRLARTLPDEEG